MCENVSCDFPFNDLKGSIIFGKVLKKIESALCSKTAWFKFQLHVNLVHREAQRKCKRSMLRRKEQFFLKDASPNLVHVLRLLPLQIIPLQLHLSDVRLVVVHHLNVHKMSENT